MLISKKVSQLKKKLKVSQQKARRLKKTVTSLKSIVKQLKEKDLISSACEEMLEKKYIWGSYSTLQENGIKGWQRMQILTRT